MAGKIFGPSRTNRVINRMITPKRVGFYQHTDDSVALSASFVIPTM